ncbi:MAG: ParB/RepB/Spo0J family partition protein [Pyrinomonadaceae bacterium]|nr:ParB/RepB/Spo0J family partition protein [Pyrinomonadaceae bacterium]
MSSKRGLPTGIQMRHDAHYVDELTMRTHRSIGKIVPIGKIAPNPEQPRVEIGDLTELTASIKQNGILEPLLLKPNGDGTWMIIAGERRWRAAALAGLNEVPGIEFDIDEQTIAEIALIENLQRKDLTIWEEADGLAHLSRKFGYTHEEIAKKIGKSRTTVTESMTIAGLPETIRAKCLQTNVSAKSTLLEIARQFDEPAMHDFVKNIGENNLKRDEIRRAARHNHQKEPAAQKNPAKTTETFRYVPADKDFSVEIRFNNSSRFEKQDILRALKQTFESIKNQS